MGNFDATTIRDIVVVLVPMILSLSVHEFAHAWSAYKLGDDTAASQGRMTLNPLAHIDLFGTILIPIFSVIFGGIGLIGWAKPVPVAPYRFRRSISMRSGMIVTALAGPASNLILAFLTGGVAVFLATRVGAAEAAGGLAQKGAMSVEMLLGRVFIMNVGLAVFNMLPIPPLDGSRLLPQSWQEKMARYYIVSFFLFLLIINFAGGILRAPVLFIGDGIVRFWSLFF